MNKLIARTIFLLLIFISTTKSSLAQSKEKDSLSVVAKHRANRAALFSAVVPGLGQAYNKKYWKLPILYAGFGTLYYFIQSNNTEYLKFKTALINRSDTDPNTVDDYPNLSNDDIQVRKDFYRRNRDLSYIITGVVYTLNILDAYVDSQLMDFDVGDNLSMHTAPTLLGTIGQPLRPGVQLTFTFK
jgi:hypothetical protein